MKKKSLIKKSLIVLLCVGVCAMFAACGSSSDEDTAEEDTYEEEDTSEDEDAYEEDTSEEDTSEEDASSEIIGTWTLTDVADADGNTYTYAEYCEMQGVTDTTESTYTFEEGGTGYANMAGTGDIALTWEFDGETLTYTMEGVETPVTMTYDGEALAYYDEVSGMTSYCTK